MQSCKRKEDRCPKKLTDFFTMPTTDRKKGRDGTSGANRQDQPSSYTDLPDNHPEDWEADLPTPFTQGSSPHSPTPNSPAKVRMRMDPSVQASGTVSTYERSDHIGLNLQSSIAALPTSGQPVLDTTMKDMLLSLQSSLMVNFSTLIHKFTSEIQGMGERVQYIEHNIDKCTTIVNDLIDAYKDQSNDNDWIKAKLADLEDHSRRNKVKIRGVPESIPPADLHKYASDMISKLLPDVSPIECTIDRIHRIPKPKRKTLRCTGT